MRHHFKTYAQNLNRIHMAEMLDYHTVTLRRAEMRASLIISPVTGLPYMPYEAKIEPSLGHGHG